MQRADEEKYSQANDGPKERRLLYMVELKIRPSDVRGFNYHPSYSHDALEDWLLFDEELWRRELVSGKACAGRS